jgi:uncharacterized protein (TIGR02246 family)
MKKTIQRALVLAAASVAVVAGLSVAWGQPKAAPPAAGGAAAPADKDRDADREAIRKVGEAFAAAFEKGDAKAIAALWTDAAEYVHEDGVTLGQRAEIEKAFAEVFQGGPPVKLELDVRSIRFPTRDVAILEGFLRHVPSGPGLPSSSRFETVLAREDGKWLIAHSREWGSHQDRLGDLAFLIGRWEGGPKGEEVTLTFTKDPDGPFINGKFTRQVDGKPGSSGTIRIGLDAGRGQIRSWHFDADGGQGQCVWLRDGDNWVLDAVGIAGDGTITGAVNILSRLGPDEIVWRSTDRMAAAKPLPDTVPIKLTRVKEPK